MGFFNRGGAQESRDERDQREQRQREDIARIAAGGIPAAAEERLRTLGAEAGQAFTSDLSVPEFGLVRRADEHVLQPLQPDRRLRAQLRPPAAGRRDELLGHPGADLLIGA